MLAMDCWEVLVESHQSDFSTSYTSNMGWYSRANKSRARLVTLRGAYTPYLGLDLVTRFAFQT